MSASTTWTCDHCSARAGLPGLGVSAPAHWIAVESSLRAGASGTWREARERDERVACSPACAEALAHELVTTAFAAGDVSSLDLSSTRRQPERP